MNLYEKLLEMQKRVDGIIKDAKSLSQNKTRYAIIEQKEQR